MTHTKPIRRDAARLLGCLLTAAGIFPFTALPQPVNTAIRPESNLSSDSAGAIRWAGIIELGTRYIDMGFYDWNPAGTNPRLLLSGGLDVRIFRVTIPMAAGSGMHFGLDIRPSIGAGGFPLVTNAALHGKLRIFFEEFYFLGGASIHWPAATLPDPAQYDWGGVEFRVQERGSQNDVFTDAGFGVEVKGSFFELHVRQRRNPRIVSRRDDIPGMGWQESGSKKETRTEITFAVGILF